MGTVTAPMCPVHGDTADYVSDAVIYGRQFGMVWMCRHAGCDYRVGAHKDSGAPKGHMADGRTREARIAAHAAFDGWWKREGLKRGAAYRELRARTGIEHIAESTVEQCAEIVKAFAAVSGE